MTFPIALEEFEAAYAATGLVPADACYLAEDRACPLGAVYAQLIGKDALAQLYRGTVLDVLCPALGLTHDQATAFLLAFDGDDRRIEDDWDAYEAGQVARARFLPPQTPEA